MQARWSSQIVTPLAMVSAGVVLLMMHFHLLHPENYVQLWPVVLIAAGIEELYCWSRGDRG